MRAEVLSYCVLLLTFVLEVLALHIDYNNRPESGAEAEFVERWCEERRIRFRARVVTECKRGVTARDVYEKQSREIRYGFYREAMERDGVRGVFFGHHQGDLQVWTGCCWGAGVPGPREMWVLTGERRLRGRVQSASRRPPWCVPGCSATSDV